MRSTLSLTALLVAFCSASAAFCAPRLEILDAKYGAEGRWRDVKPYIESIKHDYFALAEIRNSTMGGDPAPDQKKELVVRVRLGKTEAERRFNEDSSALIVAPTDPDVLKAFEKEAKDHLVILEAKKISGKKSQDWIEGVRSSVDGQKLERNSALELAKKSTVLGGGKLVIVYFEGGEIRAQTFGNGDRVQIPAHAKDSANAPPKDAAFEAPADAVVFQPLATQEPVTTFAMTPDGAYVVMAHQAADLVSVWDVRQQKIVKTFSTPAPRSIACPGDKVFIANFGKGTVSVFSIKKDWAQSDQLKIDQAKVVFVSAPIGAAFKDKLLVSCDDPRTTFLVDSAHDTCHRVMSQIIGISSYDGRLVLARDVSAQIRLYPWDEFFGVDPKPMGNPGGAEFAYSPGRGSFWINGNALLGGAPLATVADNVGKLMIPDMSQPIVYAISDQLLSARRLNPSVEEIGKRPMQLPPEQSKDLERVWKEIFRHRQLILDHPVAFVHGDDLHLFLIDTKNGMMLRAKTPAFVKPGGKDDAATAPVAKAADSEKGTDALAEQVSFGPLPTGEPVTTFAMTPDGALLLMAHQGADQVSVWDVRQEKIVKTFDTPQPRSIFCPGDQVFVANYGKGTISVFSIKNDWKQQDELKVDRDKVFYLSGAIGANFKNQLLAVCENENRQDYNEFVYLIDAAKDKCREVSRASVATVSCSGKTVITQGSFNLSPSGGIALFPWDEFIGKNAKSISATGESMLYAYPAARDSYWISCASVYAGSPISKLKEDGLGQVIIPDIQQPIVYSLGDKVMTANSLDTQLTEIGKRRFTFAKDQSNDMSRLSQFVYRHRAGLYDHPVACVQGNDLYLFAIDVNNNTIQYAKTAAFTSNGVAGKSAGGADEPKGELGLPARIASGKQLSVKLEHGAKQATYELLNGPEGMKLTSEGLLTWMPDEKDVGVHQLKIRMRIGDSVEFVRPGIEVVSKVLVSNSGGGIDKVDEFPKLELGADHFALFPGAGNRSLLLLQGNELTVLKADGFTVDQKRELTARYRWIAERSDCYVAMSTAPTALDIIDKQSIKVRRHIELKYDELTDLAIHPKRSISYVAVQVKSGKREPKFRVIIIDEASGKITEPSNLLGTWVAVAPDGGMLLTGYKDIYIKGTDYEIDQHLNVLPIPRYGDVDILFAYDIRGEKPTCVRFVSPAGVNGNGMRLSPDGERIAYLSFAGYPEMSHNISAWNPAEMKDKPVTYPCAENGASCQELAFHPTLKLAAVPNKSSAIIFDRETAQPQPDRLILTSKGLGDAKVESLIFSPDGSNLIFVCTEPGMPRYLRRVPLKLSPEERTKAAKGFTAPAPAEQPASEDPKPRVMREGSRDPGDDT